MYYNYHSKIKSKIVNGELTSYYFQSDYKSIGFALVLCIGEKKYPIREPMFDDYFKLIGENYNIQKKDEICFTTPKIVK